MQDTQDKPGGFRNKRTAPFTMLANAMLRDATLSLRAKGLLGVMLSFPDDWQYHMSHIETLSSDQRDSHRAAVRELERAGYIQRQQTRTERGRVSSSIYTVSDSILTVDGFTGDGAPVAGNPPTTKTDYTKTESTKRKDGAQERAGRGHAQPESGQDNTTLPPVSKKRQEQSLPPERGKATGIEQVPRGAEVPIPAPLMALEGFASTWGEWLAYRRKRRLSCLPETLARQLGKLATHPDPLQVLTYSLDNGYQGLIFDRKRSGARSPQEANARALDTATRTYRAITEDPDNVPF